MAQLMHTPSDVEAEMRNAGLLTGDPMELQDLSEIAADLQKHAGLVRQHHYHGISHHATFCGSEACAALIDTCWADTTAEAARVGSLLSVCIRVARLTDT